MEREDSWYTNHTTPTSYQPCKWQFATALSQRTVNKWWSCDTVCKCLPQTVRYNRLFADSVQSRFCGLSPFHSSCITRHCCMMILGPELCYAMHTSHDRHHGNTRIPTLTRLHHARHCGGGPEKVCMCMVSCSRRVERCTVCEVEGMCM